MKEALERVVNFLTKTEHTAFIERLDAETEPGTKQDRKVLAAQLAALPAEREKIGSRNAAEYRAAKAALQVAENELAAAGQRMALAQQNIATTGRQFEMRQTDIEDALKRTAPRFLAAFCSALDGVERQLLEAARPAMWPVSFDDFLALRSRIRSSRDRLQQLMLSAECFASLRREAERELRDVWLAARACGAWGYLRLADHERAVFVQIYQAAA